MPIAGQVAIVGSAATRFGVLHDRGYLELLAEAARGAIADAGIEQDDLEAAWLGTAEPLTAALLGDAGTAVTEALDFAPRPVTRVSTFCCTGMEAVRAGAMAIAAGEHEFVLAVGAEKMRDVPPRGSLVARTANLTHPTLAKGRTAPGQFALLANRYLHEYDCTVEDLAGVAVKNHAHAAHNPIAQFSDPLTIEAVLRAPRVAEPLGLLDCTPTTDGAAAVVLTSVERARELGRPYAVIEGIALAVVDGYYAGFFHDDSDYLGFRVTREAAASAYRQAGITAPREQLDVVECHDCFTITELVNYEDLGLCDRGEGASLLRSGTTTAGGEIPVNLSGGLQACGHPVGRDRRAHDQGNRRPGPRSRGRASGGRRPPRRRAHARRPRCGLVRRRDRRPVRRRGEAPPTIPVERRRAAVEQAAHKPGRGAPLEVWHHKHSRAQPRGDGALTALGRVSLGERERGRVERVEELVVGGGRRERGRSGDQEDAVHRHERRHHLAAFPGGDHRAIGALASARSLIVLDADRQTVARRPSRSQETEMPHVEKVEDARGDHRSRCRRHRRGVPMKFEAHSAAVYPSRKYQSNGGSKCW